MKRGLPLSQGPDIRKFRPFQGPGTVSVQVHQAILAARQRDLAVHTHGLPPSGAQGLALEERGPTQTECNRSRWYAR